MVNLGQKMQFIPYYCINQKEFGDEKNARKVIGTVIYVDRANKKFTVKYPCGGTMMKETFKFTDIGEDIIVVRGGGYGKRC